MRDVEQLLLRIPGVTEAQVFAKVLVRCEFPMTDRMIIALQEAQDWIEHETGWKVEMTISAGKRPGPMPANDNELNKECAAWERASDGDLLAFEKMLDCETDSASSATWHKEGE